MTRAYGFAILRNKRETDAFVRKLLSFVVDRMIQSTRD
jgi:hypothetical protein